jgi:16S rRNA processing protein RimM
MVSPRPTLSHTQEDLPRSGEAPAPRPTPAWVLVARLVRPHGRRGELVAEILTDFPEKFHQRTRLFLIPPERVGSRPREIDLENFWFLRSRIVLKFRGVETINDAEALRGFAVAIPAAERAPLEPGSVYLSDLIGCRLIDLNRDPADVGEIVDLDRGSSNSDLLVVRRTGSKRSEDLLIPFVREYLVRVDTANRRVEMRLPAGLAEINAPVTEEEKREMGNRQ